ILGTLFSLPEFTGKREWENKSYLISKSSMVGDSVAALDKNDRPVAASVLYRDEENDLVLLVLDHRIKGGINGMRIKDSLSFSDTGKWLVSPHPGNEGEISVLGNFNMNIPPVSNQGFMGI